MDIDSKIEELLYSIKNPKIVHPTTYDAHYSYIKECMKHTRKSGGLWIELGVYRGRTLNYLAAEKPNERFFGFDSFEGLPEFWNDDNPLGHFSLHGVVPVGAIVGGNQPGSEPTMNTIPWKNNIKLVKGWFNETLPPFIESHPGDIDLIHFDADLYSSTKTAFNILKSRIVPGTMLMFDEITGYPEYREHEIKAFAEFLLETNHKYVCQVVQPEWQACFIIQE